jgi:hypothetical protein
VEKCTRKRKSEDPESKVSKARGRPKGSKNKVDVVSVVYDEAKARINGDSSCNHNFVGDMTRPRKKVKRCKRRPHYESSAATIVNMSDAPPSDQLSTQDPDPNGNTNQCDDEGGAANDVAIQMSALSAYGTATSEEVNDDSLDFLTDEFTLFPPLIYDE